MQSVVRKLWRASRVSLALLCALVPVTGAAPLPEAEAEELARRGIELRRRGDDEASLPLFQRAFTLRPTPRSAVQLGLVEQALGRWTDAEEHLAAGLKAASDPWIQKNQKVIEESLRTVKQYIGRVEITGDPAGAEVTVNARKVGALPLPDPVRVNAGSVDIELSAPGHKPMLRTVQVNGGHHQTVVIRLEKTPAPTDVSTRPEQVVTRPDGTRARSEPGRPWRRWAMLGGLAAGAVALGVGGYGIYAHNAGVDDFGREGCRESADPADDNGVFREGGGPEDRCVSLRRQYQSDRRLSVASLASAGVLIGGALIVYLTTPPAPGPSTKSSGARPGLIACAPDLTRLGAACRVHF